MAAMDVSVEEPAAAAAYDFDLVVIGGGSGGLACSKAAAGYGARAAVLDFVKPSPQGSKWGLGGTCVNVGCIPKKLMHQAANLGHGLQDAHAFGWELPEKPAEQADADVLKVGPPEIAIAHNWERMVGAVQDHIGSLNWGYRTSLQDKDVKYFNAFGSFVDAHTVKTVDKRNREKLITSKYFVIATGGRPMLPDIPGAAEYCLTSDDLFSLRQPPGKTLVVGASYVALECAGFLAGLGFDTTVMVRSILLRGFDQQMAEKIGEYMAAHKVKFIRPATPNKIEKQASGQLLVTFTAPDKSEQAELFDTVFFATGRYACTGELNLAAAGVEVDPRNGKLHVTEQEQTNVPNIYAIGDVLHGKPELTPVAIEAGRLLAERLFAQGTRNCDYINIPTTVFTPIEYGCAGLSEEDALAQFGEAAVEVFHNHYTPLEWTVPHREENACYAKLVCNSQDNMRVLGMHVLGPNAGEVIQGFGIALKLGATKLDFDRLIGIHPTNAEVFTTLSVTKRSGIDVSASGC